MYLFLVDLKIQDALMMCRIKKAIPIAIGVTIFTHAFETCAKYGYRRIAYLKINNRALETKNQ